MSAVFGMANAGGNMAAAENVTLYPKNCERRSGNNREAADDEDRATIVRIIR
jgi:hypothetical protein